MATKTRFQVLSFLSQHSPKTPTDLDMIAGYMARRYQTTPRTPLFCPTIASNMLDGHLFHQWLENGSAATEIVFYHDRPAIVGKATVEATQLVGIMAGDKVERCDISVGPGEISSCTPGQSADFMGALLRSGLQFDVKNLCLCPKHVPARNEKVVYYTPNMSVVGLGAVKCAYEDTKEVELYCHYRYPAQGYSGEVGYSMGELGIVNLRDYVFEDLLGGDLLCGLNGVACFRRLKREIEKRGKVWRDKLHRVEPADPKVKRGERYWFINDRMEVVLDREKGTPKSHFRYLAGNYFTTYEAACDMAEKWNDMLRRYLAGDRWPEVE